MIYLNYHNKYFDLTQRGLRQANHTTKGFNNRPNFDGIKGNKNEEVIQTIF